MFCWSEWLECSAGLKGWDYIQLYTPFDGLDQPVFEIIEERICFSQRISHSKSRNAECE